MVTRTLTAVLVLGILGSPATAGSLYKVTEESTVTFTAQSTLHPIEGKTSAVRGRVRFDPATPLEAKGKILIDAATLKTGNAARDKDLREDVLDAKQFPKIALKMKRFVAHKAARLDHPMEGNIHSLLRFHGKTHKVAIPAKVAPGPSGQLEIHGDVAIDMTRWGVKAPKKGIVKVSPQVQVAFDLVLAPM